jgi:xanthine dehydrogenase accessory factor
MKKQLAIWQLIHSSLLKHTPVMLLYVVESKGSSPGRQGFFMAVNKNGGMEGSIGGGIMEHKFVEMAKQQLHLQENGQSGAVIKKQVHDKSSAKNQSGMICSGEQVNFLYRIRQSDLPTIQQVIQCIEEKKDGCIVLSPAGISFSKEQLGDETKMKFYFQSALDWTYKERVGYANKLFIIGGGHCALAFSKVMSMMDFYIQVYDTRPGLHTMNENHHAHEKYFINDYNDLKSLIPSGSNHFVVVMSFGYRTDQVAVSALASKSFRYFGLLGSKNKISKLLSELENDGITKEQLARIHAPVGLQIDSQTPEEIAISIAAEIIKVKNF